MSELLNDKMSKLLNDKIKKRDMNLIKEVQFYTYQFFDGKIYVGYMTCFDLNIRHKQHKQRSISPIYQYLNNPKYEVFPKIEEIVYTDIYGDEKYKIMRKILDKYTTDTTKILNKNLYLYGYKDMKDSYCIKDKRKTPCVEPSGYQKDIRGRTQFFCRCGVCGIKKVKSLKI